MKTSLLPFAFLVLASLGGCAAGDSSGAQENDDTEGNGGGSSTSHGHVAAAIPALGAHFDSVRTHVTFAVASTRATRIELWVYGAPTGAPAVKTFALTHDVATDTWSTKVKVSDLTRAGLGATIYYGYRAWGPNWTFDATWKPGTTAGFKSDVDAAGNRFNPNKLLVDPYAFEVSHDPRTPAHQSGSIFGTGPANRTADDASVAPKGIVIRTKTSGFGTKPRRAFKDEVIYEVHLRGFTKQDPSVPTGLRGTYAGAATKAAYLKALGVTAVEFLPVQESQNDTNDVQASTGGDNYWGYATLSFFAPDRRYAADKAPGGPTDEFRAMVKAFHAEGIKVYLDMVFNHTGEGGLWDSTGDTTNLLSMRGLDNAAYYEISNDGRHFFDNTGTGANFNTASRLGRDLIVDALAYWKSSLGVDGFRFDLAPVLGNSCEKGCFAFDKLAGESALNRAAKELPALPAAGGGDVDLIAEPWAASGAQSYQLGNFPSGWSEWNGKFRDTVRAEQNTRTGVSPGALATRIAGSSDLFKDDGRRPSASVNFLVAHDGFTLRDLYTYDAKNNGQPWPFGPSDGGESNNVSWDQGGKAVDQRQAARTGLALLMLSVGVPMITGGDEMYRTQHGNNNAYNLDSEANWLDWSNADTFADFADFTRRMIHFRAAHPALRRADWFEGKDHDGDGVKDITWLDPDGAEASSAYKASAANHFIGYRFDAKEAGDALKSIYVGYNAGAAEIALELPAADGGWYRVADTAAWNEADGNAVDPGQEHHLGGTSYELAARSLVLLIEK